MPEEDEIFSSVFDNNAKIAHKLHNLTGIYPVDVDEKVPSLICSRCLREVAAADLVRKRILDANEHLSMMTAEKEVKLFKNELKQLRSAAANKENKTAENFVKRPVKMSKIDDSSSDEFYVPKVFIDRNKKCEEMVAEIVNKKAKTVKRKTSKTTRTKMQRKTLTSSKMQKKILTSRTTRERIQARKVDGPKKARRVKITPRRKVPVTYECDTCKDCFVSYQELNNHMDMHNCKLTLILI